MSNLGRAVAVGLDEVGVGVALKLHHLVDTQTKPAREPLRVGARGRRCVNLRRLHGALDVASGHHPPAGIPGAAAGRERDNRTHGDSGSDGGGDDRESVGPHRDHPTFTAGGELNFERSSS